MAAFVANLEGVKEIASIQISKFEEEAEAFFQPFVEAMTLEGFYGMKVPCYNSNLVNPTTPKECMKGSPWVTQAQHTMGGKISDVGVSLDFSDNFHRVYTVTPHHLPQINNTCPASEKRPCTLEGLTVSENFYDREWGIDTGLFPNAAIEHKAKLISRESIQWHAGNVNTDFIKDDKTSNLCEYINQQAIDWAMSKADSKVKSEYMKHGKKLVSGADPSASNTGPTWVWEYLKYSDNADKTETTLSSVNLETPLNYWEIQIEGNHYCKLLSVYRALEWIYVDSLKDYSKKQFAQQDDKVEEGMFL